MTLSCYLLFIMGNIVHQHSTASRILHILRDRKSLVSGQELSLLMGISRTSVWKGVKQLQSQGIQVVSEKRGYRLGTSEKMPFDLEEIPFHGEVIFLDESSTTMDESRKRTQWKDLLVIAEEQSQGQGRQNSTWDSTRGGLFCTYKKNMDMPLYWAGRIIPAFLSGLCRDFKNNWSIPVQFQWPNSLVLQNKKTAGVLLETSSRGDRIYSISLGLGIHVNNRVDPQRGNISLQEFTGKSWSLEEILGVVSQRLEKELHALQGTLPAKADIPCLVLGPARLQHCILGSLEGHIKGLDALGNLLLEEDGQLRVISPGECLELKSLLPQG